MATQVNATVVNGMLKPDCSLTLAESDRVKLTIEPIDEWSAEKARAAWEELKGQLKAKPLHLGGYKLTRDELHERR